MFFPGSFTLKKTRQVHGEKKLFQGLCTCGPWSDVQTSMGSAGLVPLCAKKKGVKTFNRI